MEEKNFIGNGWEYKSKYGIFYNIRLKKNKLLDLEPDKYGYITLKMNKLKEPNKKNNATHYLYEFKAKVESEKKEFKEIKEENNFFYKNEDIEEIESFFC